MSIRSFILSPDYGDTFKTLLTSWGQAKKQPYLASTARDIANEALALVESQKALHAEMEESYARMKTYYGKDKSIPPKPNTSHTTLFSQLDKELATLSQLMLDCFDNKLESSEVDQYIEDLNSTLEEAVSLSNKYKMYKRRGGNNEKNIAQSFIIAQAVFSSHQEDQGVNSNLFHVTQFFTLWGSTALGFSRVGGAAMTDAITTVIQYQGAACVFYDSHFAFYLKKVTPELIKDLANKQIASLKESKRYFESLEKVDSFDLASTGPAIAAPASEPNCT